MLADKQLTLRHVCTRIGTARTGRDTALPHAAPVTPASAAVGAPPGASATAGTVTDGSDLRTLIFIIVSIRLFMARQPAPPVHLWRPRSRVRRGEARDALGYDIGVVF